MAERGWVGSGCKTPGSTPGRSQPIPSPLF